jgi:hypothetical protein
VTGRTYASPAAFKQALESRLRADAASTGRALGRQRQLVVFDRLLARIAGSDTFPWVTVDGVAAAVRAFRDSVLFGAKQTWDAAAWRWR